MSRHHLARTHLVGALLTIVAASLLAAIPTTAGATSAPAAPRVGTCHALTYAEAYADSEPDPAVPCGTRHTTRTFLVPTVPDGIDMTDDEALGQLVSRRCGPALLRVVSGGSTEKRLMSAYSYFWFTPTAAQIRAGARWVRCDLALLAGTDGINPLPRASRPQLQGRPPYADRVARCYTARQDRTNYVTACTGEHQYRARKAYAVSGKDYPSEARFQRIGERRCAPVAGKRWHQFTPSASSWYADYRYVVCASRTRR